MAENENPEATQDDVAGHMKHLSPEKDHQVPAANDDDDDVEGHMKHLGPALSGAVDPDQSTPSMRHL